MDFEELESAAGSKRYCSKSITHSFLWYYKSAYMEHSILEPQCGVGGLHDISNAGFIDNQKKKDGLYCLTRDNNSLLSGAIGLASARWGTTFQSYMATGNYRLLWIRRRQGDSRVFSWNAGL